MRRRVTFSRNLTLSLSRTCRCYCKYCAFATHQAHLHEPDEVSALLDGAAAARVKELLVLTGERPEVNPEVARAAARVGHEDFVAYVAWACERALERGMLPHTNLGVLAREDLARLREVTASQGLMLESVRPDLVVHQGSPTKHPARRLETIRAAGELRIPFTSGILVGIGETRGGAGRGARGAGRGARRARPPAGGDPPELRPAPALLRRGAGARSPTEAAERFWRTGVARRAPAATLPEWATPVRDRGDEAADRARRGG